MDRNWRFFRAGGFDQVKLETGADLLAIAELDQKLWVALACPVKGLEFDQRTLELIDIDKDSRVRASELIAATKWIGDRLKDPETLVKGSSSLPLSNIRDNTPDGKLLLDTALALLSSLKKPGSSAIDVADTALALKAFAEEPFNGDGILPPAAVSEPALRKVAEDILSCTTSPPVDRSGKPGLDKAAVDTFYEQLAAHVAWLDAASPAVKLLGDATPAAHAALTAIRAKVDDYFTRCRLAAFDPRSADPLNRDPATYTALAAQQLSESAADLRALPLAHVEAGRPLPLQSGINPSWEAAVGALRDTVVVPLLGASSALTESSWRDLCAKFAPFEAWLAAKKGAVVEPLGAARCRELLAGPLRSQLEALVAQDKAAEPTATNIENVERLVRYHRDLMKLANNFVSFRDFYARDRATFQAGTLYLDQRACDLCIRVDDAARHATMAPLAKSYLVYCDLKNAKGEKMSIVAAMTNGDVDNLMVGRNGIFYDRAGVDWDATVTKIIDNPISIRQAFWSPYKKFLSLVEDQINQRFAAAVASADAKVNDAATTLSTSATGAPPPAVKPFDVGTVAALGVAVGGITAALGALLEAFFGLGLWMPLGVLGLVLLISGPSMVVAWLKLRQRNLGPLLDANGWAVNAQAKLNVPLGESLTAVAALPKGYSRDATDPFAERTRPWPLYIALVAVVALAIGWWIGKLDPYLPGPAKSTAVLGSLAPAAQAPPVVAPPAPPPAP